MKKIRETELITAIEQAELETSGEIRVHLSRRFFETDLLKSAKQKFDDLGMHDTREKNAVLLYFNLRKRKFALWAGEGLHQKVKQDFWNELVHEIKRAIHEKDITHGMIHAISKIGAALGKHFPHKDGDLNQLSNEITHS